MTQKFIHSFLGLFLYCIVSCTHSQSVQNETDIPVIDLEEAVGNESTPLKMSDIIEKIEYIRPEYPTSVLSDIFDFHVDDNHLYLHTSQNLFCYTRNGMFLREIGHYGQGPTEHIGIRSFAVHDSTIAINSNYARKIQLYRPDGQYVARIPVPDGAYKIDILDTNRFAIHLHHGTAMKDTNLFITGLIDAKGDTVQIKKTVSDYSTGVASYPSIWYCRDTVCVKTCINDTAYSVTKEAITPRYVIRSGKYKISREAFGDLRLLESERYKYIENLSVCETRKYILLMFQLHHKRYIACYQKDSRHIYSWSQAVNNTNKYGLVKGGGLENDLDGGGLMPSFKSINSDYLGKTISPEDLRRDFLEDRKPDLKMNSKQIDAFARMIDSLDDEENPIIVLYKLK